MAERFHLLMDARMVSERPHGIARYVLDLLGEFSKQDIEISLLVSEKVREERFKDYNVRKLIKCRVDFANPLEVPELTKTVRLAKFDIVHFPSFSVPLLIPKKSVVTIHDLIHLRGDVDLAHKLYYKVVVQRALKRCGRVIAVSDWTKKDLVERLKTDSDKIKVVRNGVHPSWLEVNWSGSKAGHQYFVCLANPKDHKNVQTLIQSCRELWQQGKVFELFLSLGGHDLPANWPIS